MIISCKNEQCGTKFEVRESALVPGLQNKMRCAYCREVFYITKQDDEIFYVDLQKMDDVTSTRYLGLWNKPQLGSQDEVKREVTPPPPQLVKGAHILPLSSQDKATILQKDGWLGGLSSREKILFAQLWGACRADEQTVLFNKGATNDQMYLLIKGRINIFKGTLDHLPADEPVAVSLRPGATLSEISLLGDHKHVVSAMTVDQAEMLIITRDRSEWLFKHHPMLWKSLIRGVNDRMVGFIHALLPFVSEQSAERFFEC